MTFFAVGREMVNVPFYEGVSSEVVGNNEPILLSYRNAPAPPSEGNDKQLKKGN